MKKKRPKLNNSRLLKTGLYNRNNPPKNRKLKTLKLNNSLKEQIYNKINNINIDDKPKLNNSKIKKLRPRRAKSIKIKMKRINSNENNINIEDINEENDNGINFIRNKSKLTTHKKRTNVFSKSLKIRHNEKKKKK